MIAYNILCLFIIVIIMKRLLLFTFLTALNFKLFEFGSVNIPFFFEILAYYIDYIIIKNILTD